VCQVAALGFVSVFDQIMEGLPAADQSAVLKAFIEALKEDPEQYRRDAKSLEEWARATSCAYTPLFLNASANLPLQRSLRIVSPQ